MSSKVIMTSDRCTSAFRVVADELGFLENTDETAYKLCSGIKWFAKATQQITFCGGLRGGVGDIDFSAASSLLGVTERSGAAR